MSKRYSLFCVGLRRAVFASAAAFAVSLNMFVNAACAAEWTGVDESVVEKYAEAAGRRAWTPLINTDRGDLLLFVFLLAGAVGGFIVGYYWRVLFKDTGRCSESEGRERG